MKAGTRKRTMSVVAVVATAAALVFGTPGTGSAAPVAPSLQAFGDRLRVISETGQKLRHNLNDHTTIQDQNLNTPPIEGSTKGVTAAAYTNNDLNGATGTPLADINTTSDQVVLQSPANNGTLVPTGSLGNNAGLNAGMDIYSTLSNGKTVDNTAFASLTPNGAGTPSLYSINIFTGQATAIAQFPLNITDLAVTLTGT